MSPVEAREHVLRLITRPLSPHQDGAVADWALDVLTGKVDGLADGLQTAKLVLHINAGEMQLAAAEFPKWCLVRGKINQAALNRRNHEAFIFRQGTNTLDK